MTKYKQEWVSANRSMEVADIVTRIVSLGWRLVSVTFGEYVFTPPGGGQTRHNEDGWLLLFSREEDDHGGHGGNVTYFPPRRPRHPSRITERVG